MIEPNYPEKIPWQTQLDANKDLLEVHMPFREILGTDFKRAKFSDQDREFIMTIVGAGMMGEDICPHPEIGIKIKEMDFSYIYTLAVLKFNQDGNMIIDRITNWQQQNQAQEEDSNWIEKLTKRIKGESRPTKEKDNDD